MGKPQFAVTWPTSLCFLKVPLQRERKSLRPDSVSVNPDHPLQPPQKLKASVCGQVLPQPMKSFAASTSSPVQSPQMVGTYLLWRDLVTMESENSGSPP